jgi:HK97 family phage prohead protease
LSDINATLDALSQKHAGEVSALTDSACAATRQAYARIASAPQGDRYQQLRAAVLGAVEGTRRGARDLAATHLLAQLRAVVTGRSLPAIAMAKDPVRDEVLGYIDNAIDAARAADDAGEGIESTASWAERVIESEAFRTYDHARRVAESSLRALSDSEAERYGFRIAKQPSDLRAIEDYDVRTEGLVPVLGKRWDAVNDKRTCETCGARHGTLGLPGLEYDGGNPPIHARCRCVTTLWAVGWVKQENAMQETLTRDLRFDCELDTRELDGSARVIRNAVASDESVDSHGSILRASGWDLSRFAKNPILLWNHQSGAGPENVLGRVEARVDKKNKRLLVDLHFAPAGENPRADMVWGQIQRKEVRGLSVGFRPKKYHYEKVDGAEAETMIFDEQTLAEVSVVPVPSNENTLTEQVRSMIADQCAARDSDANDTNVTDTGTVPVVTDAAQGSATVEPRLRRRDEAMSDNKITSLPAEVAAILGTTDAEEAKRLIAKDRLRISQLEEECERARAEAAQAKVDLDKYRNEAADSAVEELVKLGLIKESNRSVAQSFARSDLAGFTEMYNEARADLAKRNAPKAHLLEPVVKVANERKPAPKPFSDWNARLRAKAAELRRNDPKMDLQTAYQTAGEMLENEVAQ